MPIRNSYGMAYYLLKQARVAIVPGDAFGADDHIRLSYATSMENLEKGMDRIVEALAKLKTAKKTKRVALNNTVTKVQKSVPVEPADRREDARRPGRRDGRPSRLREHLRVERQHRRRPRPAQDELAPISTTSGWRTGIRPSSRPTSSPTASSTPWTASRAASRGPSTTRRRKTGVLVNTDNYGPLRSLALGLVMDFAERMFGVHAVRGHVGRYRRERARPHRAARDEQDRAFLRAPQGPAVPDSSRTTSSSSATRAARRRPTASSASSTCRRTPSRPSTAWPRSSTGASARTSSPARRTARTRNACARDDCRLDRGSPYCYKASKEAHAMLDPDWIGGKARRGPADEPALGLHPEERRRLAGRGQAREGRGPADPRGRGKRRGQEEPERQAPALLQSASPARRRPSEPSSRSPSTGGCSTARTAISSTAASPARTRSRKS